MFSDSSHHGSAQTEVGVLVESAFVIAVLPNRIHQDISVLLQDIAPYH